jgi:hypothetical protein
LLEQVVITRTSPVILKYNNSKLPLGLLNIL